MAKLCLPLVALSMVLASTPVAAQNSISDDVTVTANQQIGSVGTVSGDIDIGAGARTGDVNTVSGDIDLAANARVGNLTTVSGDIDAKNVVEAGDAATVSGDIEFGANARVGALETVSGDVQLGPQSTLTSAKTVSGEILLERGGRAQKNLSTVSGSIGLIAANVGGDVVTYTGDVTIGMGSHVHGRLHVRKPQNEGIGINVIRISRNVVPRIVIGPNAVVDGPLVFEHPVKLYVHSSARTGTITGATPERFDTPRAPTN